MVAVQEMKKTSPQNSNHHHLPHHPHHPSQRHHMPQQLIEATTCSVGGDQQRRPSQTAETTADDPSEDLSYGPGIVSKLRCRYLSLALRESMEKQRHCLDNLRRATSLNNLLDRDEHKDDEEDIEDEDEQDHEGHENELKSTEARPAIMRAKKPKSTGGILKQTNYYNEIQSPLLTAEPLIGKKSATFQNFAVDSNCSTGNFATNGTHFIQQSANGNATSKTFVESSISASSATRSRHIKRGNDSLKRARSVEALLCEKSPWNFALNRTSYQHQKPSTTSAMVTIEDKIVNARERLILGTDHMPPKRLTSIIDDTERPPPDLVKQTLKMFEASANRRGRGPSRQNSKGEVANKVANYKSIIKDQKPAIVFPKPPPSPTKKFKPAAKPVVVASASELIGSPIGRKTAAVSAAGNHGAPSKMGDSSTPQHKLGNTDISMEAFTPIRTQTSNTASSAELSEHTPDIIPRHKLLMEKSENTVESAVAAADSPVTALTKKLEKLRIESAASKEFNTKQQQSKLTTERTTPTNNENETETTTETDKTHAKDVEKREIKTSANVVGGGGDAVVASDDDKNDRGVGDGEASSQAHETGTSSDLSDDEYGSVGLPSKRITKTALDNIAKAGTTQQFKFSSSSSSYSSVSATVGSPSKTNSPSNVNITSNLDTHPINPDISNSVLSAASAGKQIGVIRPLTTTTTATAAANPNYSSPSPSMETLKHHASLHNSAVSLSSSSSSHTPPLTSREIEKNRINEMKKIALGDNAHVAYVAGVGSASSSAASSLDTVININAGKASSSIVAGTTFASSSSSSSSVASGFSELDAVSAANSPLWALRKKRQAPPPAVAENTTMVFNFSNRKEVPDYIENDGVIFRRKRELPKPNESGFVLLGDLSLETSTDSDYDDFSLCPPSPCDVEFENANIVIDGKSSIRQKPKEATFHVQFNDTLTSTFEYPSESSFIVEESFSDHYANSVDLVSAYENLMLHDDGSLPLQSHQHHHVAVDEIIPLPPQSTNPNVPASASASATNTPTKNILGNLPLGSAPLGCYSPVKAPIEDFQLGVTRAPNGNGHGTTAANCNGTVNGGSIVGVTDGINGDSVNHDEPKSMQYLKPANDDLTIAYSEGAQKTDLLY